MKTVDEPSKFLSELQGIILLVYHNSGKRASAKEIIELDKDVYKELKIQLEEIDHTLLIKYLRASKNLPKDQVESRRRKAFARLGYSEPEIEQKAKELLKYDFELPTKFQNEDTYTIIEDLLQYLLPSVRQLKFKLDSLPIFASTQTYNFNAMVIQPRSEISPIILFDDDTFIYCHLIAKSFVNCLGKENGKISFDEIPFKSQLGKHPIIADNFGEIIHFSLQESSIVNVKPFRLLGHERYFYLSMITDTMEFFLLGHELGHLIAGHLKNGKSQYLNHLDADLSNLSWQKEYQADEIGLEVALHTLKKKGYPIELHFLGIELLYTFLHLRDVARAMLNGQNDLVYSLKLSHPPPYSRLEKLREHYFKLTKNDIGLKVANNGYQIFTDLWLNIKEKFLKINLR